jgi:hypothetical protein
LGGDTVSRGKYTKVSRRNFFQINILLKKGRLS